MPGALNDDLVIEAENMLRDGFIEGLQVELWRRAEAGVFFAPAVRHYHCAVGAMTMGFDLPEQVCLARNRVRPDRDFGAHVVRRQLQDLHRSLRGLQKEGFGHSEHYAPVERCPPDAQ